MSMAVITLLLRTVVPLPCRAGRDGSRGHTVPVTCGDRCACVLAGVILVIMTRGPRADMRRLVRGPGALS